MAQLRESSGLLSLAALRSDAERTQKQAELARAQAEAEQRSRLAAEREREREKLQRDEHERAARLAAEATRQAELGELDRSRDAELERAEREARARRELELSLAEARLAWRQTKMRLATRLARARLFNSLSAAVCLVTWFGTFALYVGLVRPNAEGSRVALLRAQADAQQMHSDAAATLARASQREAALRDRVSSLEKAQADEPARADTPPSGTPQKPRRVGAAHGAALTSHGPCQDDGDPLNPCLKR